MKIAHLTAFESFGTRSLAVHGIMVLAFVNAVFAGLFVGGQLGTVSFVALLNFTAGLWVAHSIHSLGTVSSDDDYAGVLNELFETEADSDDVDGFDAGRFGRLLGLIAAVTAISLLTSAQVLSGAILSVAVVAVGAIALVTAIIGFLIALGAAYDESQERTRLEIERHNESADLEFAASNEQ